MTHRARSRPFEVNSELAEFTLDEFYFKWLENSVIEIGKTT